MDYEKSKQCERCGMVFGCGSNCWCTELPVSRKALEEITNAYDNCLCPECLKVLSGYPVEQQNP